MLADELGSSMSQDPSENDRHDESVVQRASVGMKSGSKSMGRAR
jgi:hypothetical protein